MGRGETRRDKGCKNGVDGVGGGIKAGNPVGHFGDSIASGPGGSHSISHRIIVKKRTGSNFRTLYGPEKGAAGAGGSRNLILWSNSSEPAGLTPHTQPISLYIQPIFGAYILHFSILFHSAVLDRRDVADDLTYL